MNKSNGKKDPDKDKDKDKEGNRENTSENTIDNTKSIINDIAETIENKVEPVEDDKDAYIAESKKAEKKKGNLEKIPAVEDNKHNAEKKNCELRIDYKSVEKEKKGEAIRKYIMSEFKNEKKEKEILCNKTNKKKMCIYKVKHDSQEYALKVLDINIKEDPKLIETVRKGYTNMKPLGDEIPFFIKAYEMRKTKINEEYIRVEILMEYGGETISKLKATEKEIKIWIMQSLEAFMYLAERKKCHFDIKPDNMTYINGSIKIIDLESSAQFKFKNDVKTLSEEAAKEIFECTMCYAPPEIWEKAKKIMAEKDDVFCWAVSFFQIISQLKTRDIVEFRKKGHDEFLKKVSNNENLKRMGVIYEVIKKCLSYNPEERPSFKEIKSSLSETEIEKEVCENEIMAKAYSKIGEGLRAKVSNYELALYYNEKALELYKKLTGDYRKGIAMSYNNIALVYYSRRKYKESLEYYDKALNILHSLSDLENKRTAECYNNIAMAYYEMMNKKKALEYANKAFEIRKRLYEEDHIDTAISYNTLALIYDRHENKEKKLKLYEKALSICEKNYGEYSVETAISYHNLAVECDSEDKKRAQIYYEKALNIYIILLGEEHTDVATLYLHTGSFYSRQKNYKKSSEYHKKSLNILMKLFGENSEEIAESYGRIAYDYKTNKIYNKALEYYEKSLNIFVALFRDHEKIAESYDNIASNYKGFGDSERALEYYKRALKCYPNEYSAMSIEHNLNKLRAISNDSFRRMFHIRGKSNLACNII